MPAGVLKKQYNTLATLLKPHKIRLEKDYRLWRRNRETYIQQNIEEIDLSKMSGRIKYYRVLRGFTRREMGAKLGYVLPDSYTRSFENPQKEPGDLEKVTKIC